MTVHDSALGRRQVLAGAGIAVGATAIAACSGSGTKGAAPTSASAAPSGGKPGVLAQTAQVPVGAGLIVGDVVLTQPTAGVFKGLSTECPHKGCAVSAVADGEITCPCHGSAFGLDGAVLKGPATKPLAPVAVTVQGQDIVKG